MRIQMRRKGSPAERLTAIVPELRMEPELIFVEPGVESFLHVYERLAGAGARTVALRPFTGVASDLAKALLASRRRPRVFAVDADPGASLPKGVQRIAGAAPVDATFICGTAAADVSTALMACVDAPGVVVAPRTAAFWNTRPLFLISIPKAGTHLLYELARAFGYTAGIVCPPDPEPGSWYCVEYSNSHTSAKDFFVDTVRRSHFGNRLHPFLRSPAIFIYRNPLDILVSEANYYHRDGKTAFYGYLSQLPFETRLLKLIDDPWLLGSLRDRIGNFLPWLELPNVIPVSFEELVGAAGGASDEVQTALIWSLQLKLHVPGRPAAFGRALFNRDSATFREGQIGGYQTQLTAEALDRVRGLPQDFMTLLGYRAGAAGDDVLPRRAEEFRRRPLKVSEASFDFPVAVEYGYRGYNIVISGGRYVGLAQGSGPLDIAHADLAAMSEAGTAVRGESLESVKAEIDRRDVTRVVHEELKDDAAEGPHPPGEDVPQLIQADYFGFNIVAYGGRGYALALEMGPLDLRTTDLTGMEASEQCLVRATAEEARRAVLELRLRTSERGAVALRDAEALLRHELNARAAELAAARADVARAVEGTQMIAGHIGALERTLAAAQETHPKELAALRRELAGVHETHVAELTSLREELAAARERHAQQADRVESELKRAREARERRAAEVREIERTSLARNERLEAELVDARQRLERRDCEAREFQAAVMARTGRLEADISTAITTLEQQTAAANETTSAHRAQVVRFQTDLSRALETVERRDAESREREAAHAARVHALEKDLSVGLETIAGLSILLREREERIAWLRGRAEASSNEVAAAHGARVAADTQALEAQEQQRMRFEEMMERLRVENDELRRWIERLQDELVDGKSRRGLMGRR
jgi:hypothetical protein